MTDLIKNITPVLEIDDLAIAFGRESKSSLTVVRSATVSVAPGQIVGLVGESGSGKSVTALAATGLIRNLGGRIVGGRMLVEGRDVAGFSPKDWVRLRGATIGMVFQQPTRSLNPAFTVGDQIAEVLRIHRGLGRKEALARAVEMLDRVRIPRAAERARDYPHQFSGGMCQRVAIAMALVGEPTMLIADEPTTALDVTVQRKILDLILELRAQVGIGVLLITHDLGVVAETCDSVAVMYAGEVVERNDVEALFARPQHPYTAALLQAIPRSGRKQRLTAIDGQVPAPGRMPVGCRFAPRCAHALDEVCTREPLDLVELGDGRWSRCARVSELTLAGPA